MTEKNENKFLSFIKRYAAGLLAGCVLLLLGAYFINIMFVQNQKTAVSVLVLEFMEDTSRLERQIREAVGLDEEEKIEIRTISYGVQANKAVALTWIRAEVVDVIIGEEEQMAEFAQAGYLKDLSKSDNKMGAPEKNGPEENEPERNETEGDGAGSCQFADFLCGLAEYDQDGNITGTGPETCFGSYIAGLEGIEIKTPVAGLADNAANMDNALRLLHSLEIK